MSTKHIFLTSINNGVNIAEPVCMKAYILESVTYRTTKFGDILYYYCTKIKIVLSFGNACFRFW